MFLLCSCFEFELRKGSCLDNGVAMEAARGEGEREAVRSGSARVWILCDCVVKAWTGQRQPLPHRHHPVTRPASRPPT
ncbi:hypothetical protein BS78_02G164600 [Paspalum vaginatum]|nr:hypothetical protein BS78_02G164600 [Paspalum vaginatum]